MLTLCKRRDQSDSERIDIPVLSELLQGCLNVAHGGIELQFNTELCSDSSTPSIQTLEMKARVPESCR